MELRSYSAIDLVISGVLALIMFGIGLSLTFGSFREIFTAPRSLLAGLFAQMVLLPAMAFLVVWPSDLPPVLKVGFIILAACPGGTTSGFITYFFKGNVALSISLTSVNSLLTLFSIPFIVNIGLAVFLGKTTPFHLPYLETILQIFAVAIIPALLGVWVRMRWETFAEKIRKFLKVFLIIMLAVVFTIKFFAGESQGGTGITRSEVLELLPFALAVNILGFVIGVVFGHLLRLGPKTSYTIGVEVTMQNTTLAFLVAGTLLQSQDMVKPSLIYSMFSFWTAILFSFLLKAIHRIRLFDEFKE